MFRSRSALVGLFLIILPSIIGGSVTQAASTHAAAKGAPAGLQVTLSAPHTTISWDVRDPSRERFDLPLLYLHRGRGATAAAERTLTLQIAGLAGGSEIRLEAKSLHQDVESGAAHMTSRSVRLPDRPCTPEEPCTVDWTIDPASTPSDLYTLRLTADDGETLWESGERPAFVALDTWDIALGDHVVRVYYATLFPFARGQNDLDNRLSTHQVSGFVENTFLPIVRETWQTQFVEWDFGALLDPAWDDDNLIEIIITDPPYALLDGTGTYSRLTDDDGRPYPQRRIWWFAANNAFQAYDTLENAYKAVFAHEFFHLMQWNVLLSTGRPTNLWVGWIEGQGRFAPSVQYPELEMTHAHLVMENSAYASAANRFLVLHQHTSYSELEGDRGNKYDSALYWRFLYEQYDGMGVIRAALEEMANHFGPDTVGAMKEAMDAALARVDGPFHTYEESLIAFAQASYALRLANGRTAPADGADQRAALADPDGMYVKPPLAAELPYSGVPLSHTGAVPTSYGTDLVEIKLDRSTQGRPLAVTFQGQGSTARFNVQIWQLRPGYAGPRAVTSQPTTMRQNGDDLYAYVIPEVDVLASNRLALIITRLDPDETRDPVGEYWLTLK